MQDQNTRQKRGTFLPKTKRKTKRRILIAAAVVIVLAALVLPGLLGSKETAQLDLTDTTVLAYTDLQSTISASGTVESAARTTVYSTVSYPVMAVHAKVGDYVQAGDLLAELDDHSIRNQITSQQINLDLSAQSSNQQVQAAQENYDNFKAGLDQGLNSTLNSAKNQVDTAYNNYENALTTYNRYRSSLDDDENTALINAETALANADDALAAAQKNHDAAYDAWQEADELYEDLEAQQEAAAEELDATAEAIAAATAELETLNAIAPEERTEEQQARITELELQLPSLQALLPELEAAIAGLQSAAAEADAARTMAENQLESAKTSLKQARRTYDAQQAAYHAALTNADNTLADYKTNAETAWETYQNALTALASTEKTVKEQLKSYENSLTSAQIGANKASAEESLRQLEENLEDTRVTAPVAGTVTAVYAKVGSTGSGLLFVIEDVDDLIITTSVKGYDVGTVQTGMKVRIRSDATGSAELDGLLTSIAPTSNKNSLGQTDTTGEPVFAAEVAVTSQNTGLRIGMEAQLDYILAEEFHVLAVPYDAVYRDESGQTCILIAEPVDDEDHYRIRSIAVTTGMDDDLDMVVTGPEITEGLRVINEADSYLELVGQTVLAGTGLQSAFPMMGGPFA